MALTSPRPNGFRSLARGLLGLLVKQPTQPPRPGCTPPSSARSALVALVATLCKPGEVLRYVKELPDGLEIVDQIPQTTSPVEVYEEVVDAFIRRGAVQDLLDLLVRHRPRRFGEIQQVAVLFGPS